MSRILLAEDDKNFGLVLKSELEDDGYIVDLVGDGVEAVLRIIDNPHGYCMAIVDIKMPVLDGVNALRIMKRISESLPAIAISGNAGSGDIGRALAAGAAHCLSKPFPLATIRNVMRAVLHGTGPADA